jgi:hypothetical protein
VPAHSGPTNWRAGEGGGGLQEPGGPGRPMGYRLPRSRGPQTLGDGSASRQTDRASSPGVGNDLPRTELGRRPSSEDAASILLGRHRHLGTAQGGGIAFLASGPETRPCPRAERAVGRARKCGRGHLFRFTVPKERGVHAHDIERRKPGPAGRLQPGSPLGQAQPKALPSAKPREPLERHRWRSANSPNGRTGMSDNSRLGSLASRAAF